MSSQDLASNSPRLDPEQGGGQRSAPEPPQDGDPALALRVLAAEVGRSAHRVHLGLAVATTAAIGLAFGPDTGSQLPLTALQRGVLVGAAVGALNLAVLVWLGERLMGVSLVHAERVTRPGPEPESEPEPEPEPEPDTEVPASAASRAEVAQRALQRQPQPSDGVRSGAAGAAATAVVASGKLVVIAVLLWVGKRWLAADPAGLVVGISLAPVALAAVAWRRLHRTQPRI